MRTQQLSADYERAVLTVLEESESAMVTYEEEVDPPALPSEEMPDTRSTTHPASPASTTERCRRRVGTWILPSYSPWSWW